PPASIPRPASRALGRGDPRSPGPRLADDVADVRVGKPRGAVARSSGQRASLGHLHESRPRARERRRLPARAGRLPDLVPIGPGAPGSPVGEPELSLDAWPDCRGRGGHSAHSSGRSDARANLHGSPCGSAAHAKRRVVHRTVTLSPSSPEREAGPRTEFRTVRQCALQLIVRVGRAAISWKDSGIAPYAENPPDSRSAKGGWTDRGTRLGRFRPGAAPRGLYPNARR